MKPLPYPVVWADAKTAAALFCMAESTFREHVASGLLPKPAPVGGKRLWRVSEIDEALANLLPSAKDDAQPGTDPVSDLIRGMGNGQAKKGGRRHAA